MKHNLKCRWIIRNSPTQMVAGDLWIDNLNNKLYFYDGTELGLAGPTYTKDSKEIVIPKLKLYKLQNLDRVVIKCWWYLNQ